MSMATNMTPSKALLASLVVLSICTSSIPATSTSIESLGSGNTSMATCLAQAQGFGPTRTEELILAELRLREKIQSNFYTSMSKKRGKNLIKVGNNPWRGSVYLQTLSPP